MQCPPRRTAARPGAILAVLFDLVLAAGLAACGGGGGGGDTLAGNATPVAAAPPASAQGPGPAPAPAGSPAPAPGAQVYAFLVLDPLGQAGTRSLNARGQAAYNTDSASRFFDGTTTQDIVGGMPSRATAVNDAGQVTGFVTLPNGEQRYFFWSAQAPAAFTVQDAQPGTAGVGTAINQGGQVAGTISRRGIATAFRWTPGVGLDTLPAIGAPEGTFPSTTALFINASGAVAGASTVPDARTRAALWVPGAPVRDLGTLGGGASSVNGLNDANQVIGASDVGGGISHAFRWSEAEGMRDLGTLGGTTSGASGINASGWVIGTSTTADGRSLAFVWRGEGGLQSLDTLGGEGSAATAINASGQVAGTAQTADGTSHAFLWSDGGGMVDLNTRLAGKDAPVLQSVIALADDGSLLAASRAGLVLLRPQ